MVAFILTLIVFVALFSVAFFYIGKRNAYSKVLKNTSIEGKISTEEIIFNKEDCSLGITIGLYIGIVTLFFFLGAGLGGLRTSYIDKWRSNEIIEQVNYKYHRINGEQVAVDSTFIYIKNPNFKK